jgi:hypothetical protein
MILVQRGTAKQLQSGRWVIEVETDSPDLVLSPVGAVWAVTVDAAHVAQPAPEVSAQTIGDAGAGDGFTLGGGRTLSTVQEKTMRFVMALVAMPPFQQYAQAMQGVSECPDTQVLAQQFLVSQCGHDLLSEQGIAQLRELDARFREWSDESRYELTFHADLP